MISCRRDAGGKVTDHGEFVSGEPYLFARDPDGYKFEIWYEIPTVADPLPRKRKRAKTARK